METELRNRLSFPWLLKEQRPRQTLAFVGNLLRYPGFQGTGSNHYSAAKALNVNLILLDEPGSWLEDPKYSDWRGDFTPISLKRDGKVAQRIIDALAQYQEKINGIVTFHESLAFEVAKAAEHLSLPTANPASLEIAIDKYQASVAEGHSGRITFSTAEALKAAGQPGLKYPLILKPTHGGASEEVSEVSNLSDIATAVKATEDLPDRFPAEFAKRGMQFVMEEYCDGLEVDVNVVLYEGDLVFLEICDEVPKTGDVIPAGKNHASGFTELAQLYPSKLPAPELNMLSRSLHRSLIRYGLHSGMFHCEARVRGSKMAFDARGRFLDLEYR